MRNLIRLLTDAFVSTVTFLVELVVIAIVVMAVAGLFACAFYAAIEYLYLCGL